MVEATWHLFWWRPDRADRYLVEPLETHYQRVSIISLEGFTGIIALSDDEARRLAHLYPKLNVLLSERAYLEGALAKLESRLNPFPRHLRDEVHQHLRECRLLRLAPTPPELRLLVSSALHMPRAVQRRALVYICLHF
jgi:hypothetical protein